jgi:hypothetical protein
MSKRSTRSISTAAVRGLAWLIPRGLPNLLAVLFAVALSGCMTKSTPPGAAIVGGKVGRAGFTFLRWEQGLEIMIWHDLDSSSNHGSGSTGDPVYRLSGSASSPDGRRVDWQAQTMDGMAAQFWMDGVSYDLAKGALFVVTTRNGTTDVKQLFRDLSGIQADYDSCVAFAKGDPDLVRLIDGLSDSQSEGQLSGLTDRAKGHLQARLGIRREDILVINVQSLESLCYESGDCARSRPGYVIRLVAEDQVYEYRARVLGEICILWCEVQSEPTAIFLHETIY